MTYKRQNLKLVTYYKMVRFLWLQGIDSSDNANYNIYTAMTLWGA